MLETVVMQCVARSATAMPHDEHLPDSTATYVNVSVQIADYSQHIKLLAILN